MLQIEINDYKIIKGDITVSYFLGDEEKEITFDYDLLEVHAVEEGLNIGTRVKGCAEMGDFEEVDHWIEPKFWVDENTNEALVSYLEKLHANGK